jgi:hypothetical protein
MLMNQAVPAAARMMHPPAIYADDIDDAVSNNKCAGNAYAQLQKLASELRQRQPQLSAAQAFSKVFCSPAHRALAERERRESRPRAR